MDINDGFSHPFGGLFIFSQQMYYSLSTPKCTRTLDTDIKVSKTIRPHIPIKEWISNLFEIEEEKVYAISDENITVLERMQCRHGLVAAVLQAYNGHQHLCFSPDDIWLTIAQGVNAHIKFNPEKFKNKIIKFNGEQKITLNDNLSSWDWSMCVQDIVKESTKLIENIDLKSLLECNFSTSTSNTIIASRIILLDTIKKFFPSCMGIYCGIPKITLEGKLEDWLLIQNKLVQLRHLDLGLNFWLDELDPIIYQFIETFKGNVDIRFWKDIAREEYDCGGPPELNGWITKFFPYDRNGELVNDWLDEYVLPDGRISVKFNVERKEDLNEKFDVERKEDINEKKEQEDLLLVTGFLGVKQLIIENSDEIIVKPIIGWAIVEEDANPIMNTNRHNIWC